MFLLVLTLNSSEEGTTDGTLPCKVMVIHSQFVIFLANLTELAFVQY